MLSRTNNIYTTDSFAFNLCKFSFCVKKAFKTSPPRNNLNDFKEEIKNIIVKHKIDIVIPMNEEVFYISQIKNELEKITNVFCEDINCLDRYHSKIDIYDNVNKELINCPKTEVIKDQAHLDEINKNNKDFIVKLKYSRFANDVHFSPKKLNFNLDTNNKWLFQEKITGKEFCTYAIAEKGKVKAQVCYRPLYRIKESSSVYFKNESNESIFKFVEAFIKKNNYTGQIGFDIIENEEGLHLIECNPRATSGIHLLDDNFSLDDKDKIYDYTGDKKLSLAMLIFGERDSYETKGCKYKQFFKAREAIFKIKDPLPSLFQFLLLFEAIKISKKHKIGLINALTYDIEWNGKKDINNS